MNRVVRDIGKLVNGPVEAASRLGIRPVGIMRRTPLGVVDRLRGGPRLEDRVRDRVTLITGASSGIGEAAAIKIGEAGGTVVLVARGADKLQDTAARVEEAGGSAHVQPCDLTSYEAIDDMAARVLEEFGGVDILVNNAGRSIRRSIALSYDRFHDFERTMQLNYFAAVRLILKFLPGMRERGEGHIVNISSVGVQTRVPRFSAYIASKAALDTFSDSVQAEVFDDGVRFSTIHMPLVRTPMISPTKLYDRFPALTPDEAAELVAKAIVHRPRRIGAPFGQIASLADAASPEIMDMVRNRGYKMFPDSRAARGDKGRGPEETVSPTGAAFARATRGVHW